MTIDVRQLRLWQLISPALPVGAYHFSQGMEYAVLQHQIADADDTRRWLEGLLGHGLAHVDLPIIARAMTAWQARDEVALSHWDTLCRACRETAELRDEDRQMGAALGRLAVSLELPWPEQPQGFASAFGVMAVNWEQDVEPTLAAYAWSWLENQVAAAIKLVPLGHTAGQRLLLDLTPAITAAVDRALTLADDDIGLAAPGFALASTLHETQYSRLFRS